MKTQFFYSLDLFRKSFRFWFAHRGIITLLMGFAGLGRAIQMGIVGPISSGQNNTLEVLVEGARLLTVAAIIGHGHVFRGGAKLTALFRLSRSEWGHIGRSVWKSMKANSVSVVGSLLIFSLMAFLMNKGNQWIAERSVVSTALQSMGFGLYRPVDMPVFFFLKNLTVIPFTLVFEYCLFRWCLKHEVGFPSATPTGSFSSYVRP